MKKEMFEISKLKVNPKNPRIIKDEKFKRLCKSIQDFPEMMPLRPIIYDENKIILGGNMRFKALQHLGMKEVPADWVKSANELNEEQKKEFVIKDNNSFGEYDYDLLANEWDDLPLEEWGIDLPDFEIEQEAKEDDYVMPDKIETDIVLGDLIEIGQHRLLCGSSTDSDAVAKLMNAEKADLGLTDPPYNINYEYNSHKDTLSEKQYSDFIISYVNNLILFSQRQIITSGKQNVGIYYKHFVITEFAVWYAKNKMSGSRIANLGLCEPILFIGKFDRKSRANDMFEFNVKQQKDTSIHTCPKVIDFFAELIKCYSANLILDLFLGSGTTMVAAHQLNRKCYGMEIDPQYCQVIVDRMKLLDATLEVKINGKVIS